MKIVLGYVPWLGAGALWAAFSSAFAGTFWGTIASWWWLYYLASLLVYTITGLWSAHAARKRKRNYQNWFVAGLYFGPIAVLLAYATYHPEIPKLEARVQALEKQVP